MGAATGEVGVVLAHERHDRGAGGGDVALVAVGFEQPAKARATRSAPKATLWTAAKPSSRVMATSWLSSKSVNSAGKLGATMAVTLSPEASRSNVRSTSPKACLAFCEHTRKQLAQPMHARG